MPGGTATPWTAPAPATSPASTSSTPPDELGTRVLPRDKLPRHSPTEGLPETLAATVYWQIAGSTRQGARGFLRHGMRACEAEWKLPAGTHDPLKLWRHTVPPRAARPAVA